MMNTTGNIRDSIDFHARRAMAELDLALSAASISAAKAHFSLSTLHLEKMRSLTAGQMPADMLPS